MKRLIPFICLALLSLPTRVSAHAEEPNAQSVFALPDGAFTVRANFGIVTSSRPDRFACEEAFLGGDGWILGVLGPTEWLTFGEASVTRTEDGCQFDRVMVLPQRPSDATADPDSGLAAFLLNGPTDAGLWLSTDRGRTFELVPGFDTEAEQLTGVRIADGDTLIVSAYVRADGGAARMYRVSAGDRTVTPLELPTGLTFPYVQDVEGGSIAVLSRRDSQLILWGDMDDFAAADEIPISTWPSGAILSQDGATIWIGGTESGKGVTRGVRSGGEITLATLVPDSTVSCLGGDETAIYACALGRLDGADVFSLEDEALETVLEFRAMRGPRNCSPETSVGEVCPLVWREIAAYFGADPNADFGSFEPDMAPTDGDGGGDMGAGADDDRPANTAGGGCCSTTDSPSRRTPWGLLAAALVAAVFTRRRIFASQKPASNS